MESECRCQRHPRARQYKTYRPVTRPCDPIEPRGVYFGACRVAYSATERRTLGPGYNRYIVYWNSCIYGYQGEYSVPIEKSLSSRSRGDPSGLRTSPLLQRARNSNGSNRNATQSTLDKRLAFKGIGRDQHQREGGERERKNGP